MKRGQKLLVIRPCMTRGSYCNQYWTFSGDLMFHPGCYKNGYGEILEATNFPESCLSFDPTRGVLLLRYTGVSLVKILYWTGGFDFGVGVFVERPHPEISSWGELGCICLLSDREAKKELRKTYKGLTLMGW